jgi:hypothetical protein
MSTQSQALLLADVSPYLENSEKSQWIMSAAVELRRLDQLAMEQHTEIYGLRAEVRNLLYDLKNLLKAVEWSEVKPVHNLTTLGRAMAKAKTAIARAEAA